MKTLIRNLFGGRKASDAGAVTAAGAAADPQACIALAQRLRGEGRLQDF